VVYYLDMEDENKKQGEEKMEKVTVTIGEDLKKRIERYINRDADTADKQAVEYIIYEIAEKLKIKSEYLAN